jgi:hypothetical protein
LYHAYVYLEFLILACTIYILAPNMENDVKNINQLILIRSKLMRAIISSKLQYKNTQKLENLEI